MASFKQAIRTSRSTRLNQLLSFTVGSEADSMVPMLRGRGGARHVWSSGHIDRVKNAKDVKWQAKSS